MEDANYPMGVKNSPNAPWNQNEKPSKEVEVTVIITLSKTVKINTEDYDIYIEEDEDGSIHEYMDYSNCSLREEVQKQIYLPSEAGYIVNNCKNEGVLPTKEMVDDLSNWNIDDFTVIPEE